MTNCNCFDLEIEGVLVSKIQTIDIVGDDEIELFRSRNQGVFGFKWHVPYMNIYAGATFDGFPSRNQEVLGFKESGRSCADPRR